MNGEHTEDGRGALPPELAELAGVAAAADARGAEAEALAPGQAVAPVPTVADVGGDLAAMLQSVVAMAEPVAPYLARAYTPDVCDRIGIAVAAVAEKRGWDMEKLSSPELVLAFVTIPPTVAAVKMAKDFYAWQARQAQPAANDSNVVPFPTAATSPAD